MGTSPRGFFHCDLQNAPLFRTRQVEDLARFRIDAQPSDLHEARMVQVEAEEPTIGGFIYLQRFGERQQNGRVATIGNGWHRRFLLAGEPQPKQTF